MIKYKSKLLQSKWTSKFCNIISLWNNITSFRIVYNMNDNILLYTLD